MSTKFSVVGPVSEEVGKGVPEEKVGIAPRLADLNGKTVCEVWNGRFRGDALFPIIREQLKKRYPGVKVIPYTESSLLEVSGDTDELCESLLESLLQKGCDAVIAGVGA